jgi:hypothetical protein
VIMKISNENGLVEYTKEQIFEELVKSSKIIDSLLEEIENLEWELRKIKENK